MSELIAGLLGFGMCYYFHNRTQGGGKIQTLATDAEYPYFKKESNGNMYYAGHIEIRGREKPRQQQQYNTYWGDHYMGNLYLCTANTTGNRTVYILCGNDSVNWPLTDRT